MHSLSIIYKIESSVIDKKPKKRAYISYYAPNKTSVDYQLDAIKDIKEADGHVTIYGFTEDFRNNRGRPAVCFCETRYFTAKSVIDLIKRYKEQENYEKKLEKMGVIEL